VTGMEKIEAAIGEDQPLAVAVLTAEPGQGFISTQNARMQGISPWTDDAFARKARKPLF